MNHNPIICALDTRSLNEVVSIANALSNKVSMIKLGLEFFTANGLHGVQEVAKCGIPIFLDLKLHDIPNTVARTLEVIARLDVDMLTLHVNGGVKMMTEALSVVRGTQVKLIGVTILTSIDDRDLSKLGIGENVKSKVVLLAKLAKETGLFGVVCSALETQAVRKECGKDVKIITPGIRLSNHNIQDQKRVVTPKEAVALGADYIVIGRSITQSVSPANAVESILQSLHST